MEFTPLHYPSHDHDLVLKATVTLGFVIFGNSHVLYVVKSEILLVYIPE